MTYKKKLIEVALPLDAINKACKDDKDRKTGHIRNLHKWYAPMPLPAWRAALFSSLIDDPGAGHSEDIAKCKRDDLFRELEKILPLDAAKDPSLFDSVKKLIRSAEIEVPTVIDPFCGGGSTLLEAQRLGFKTIGSDLNPVPLLITTVLTRYPSLFSKVSAVNPASTRQSRLANEIGSGFVEDIKYYANLVGERASLELKQYFPALKFVKDGVAQEASVMSWIWTRTARCPNPACSMITPLASSFELTRSNGGKNEAHWINPKIIDTADGPKVEYGLGTGPNPTRPPKSGRGAKFQCIRCTSVLDDKYIRTIAQSTGLGFDLMACVVKLANGKREYLPATPEVLATISSPKSDWKPDLELSTHPQYMGAPRYGMTNLADLFTPRQTKTLEVFSKQVRNICNEIEADGSAVLGEKAKQYAEAIVTVLALCVSKMSQSHNILVRWKIDSRNGSGKPLPAFDNQTVPVVWDFAENNPFGGSVGDWSKTVVPTALRAFDFCVPTAIPAEIYHSDARSAAELGSGPLLVATDPPYYDNVPYADLSDLFYPLLRFILRDIHPNLFQTVRAPRSSELVADYFRFDGNRERAQTYFLDGFREVFSKIRPRLSPNTPMTVVYSFKQQETHGDNDTASTGWEVMLRALIEAGFMVTATWPVRTTSDNRTRDIGSNALATAILIICRPRTDFNKKATRREFVNGLNEELPGAIRRLQESSIAPVDLQQAMIGSGMAVYSSYVEVINASGESLSVREALSLINSVLDSILTDQEGDFDADTRWALTWFEQTGFAEGDYGVAEQLSKSKNTAVSGLVEAGILVSKAGKVRLLKPAELPTDWDPTTDKRLTVWEMVHQLIRVLEASGEGTTAALVAKLGSQAETARELCYRLYTLCERKKRATEAMAYNGLVQSWPEITRLARDRIPAPTTPAQADLL